MESRKNHDDNGADEQRQAQATRQRQTLNPTHKHPSTPLVPRAKGFVKAHGGTNKSSRKTSRVRQCVVAGERVHEGRSFKGNLRLDTHLSYPLFHLRFTTTGLPEPSSPTMQLLATAFALVAAASTTSTVSAFIPHPRLAPSTAGSSTISRTRRSAATLAAPSSSVASNVQDTLKRAFPTVQIPAEFLSAISPPGQGTDPERAVIRAKAFAAMAPRVLITRGWDVLSDDFVYYSSATGLLDRAEYLGLVCIMERALPDLRQSASKFEVTNDGAVMYVSEAVGTFTGQLILGEAMQEGNGLKYQGLGEACVVAFNDDGQLQSLSAGLVVEEESDGKAEGVAEAAQVELMKRLASHVQKLEMTPTGKSAREKIQQDIDSTQAKIDAFEKAGETVKVGTGAGLGGLLQALGVDVPKAEDLREVLVSYASEPLLVMEASNLITVPTEVISLMDEKEPMTEAW